LGGASRRVLALWLVSLLALVAPAFAATDPIEDYASYEPQTVCRSKALPGTKALARWVNRSFAGGKARATIRACNSGGRSEHKDGRAIDWMVSATSKRDRTTVNKFLTRLRATDRQGNEDALARRMGVMYVIWNDRMYAAWREFEPEPYLNSSCKKLRTCSRTLRHRDHVHISLSHAGGRGHTSWYAGRL
jgi:hypothetical protein